MRPLLIAMTLATRQPVLQSSRACCNHVVANGHLSVRPEPGIRLMSLLKGAQSIPQATA